MHLFNKMDRLQYYFFILIWFLNPDSYLEDWLFILFSEKYLLTPIDLFLILINQHDLNCEWSMYKSKAAFHRGLCNRTGNVAKLMSRRPTGHVRVSMVVFTWAILLASRIRHDGRDNVPEKAQGMAGVQYTWESTDSPEFLLRWTLLLMYSHGSFFRLSLQLEPFC